MHRHIHTHKLSLIVNTLGVSAADTDTPTLPYTPPTPQLPGEQCIHWRNGPLSQLHLQVGGSCVCRHACKCVLAEGTHKRHRDLVESIIKGLSTDQIASHSLRAGQRICPPLLRLPKGLLLTPLPPQSRLLSLDFSHYLCNFKPELAEEKLIQLSFFLLDTHCCL